MTDAAAARSAADESDGPQAARTPLGWVSIGERHWWTMWSNVQWFLVVLLAANVANMSVSLARQWDVPVPVAVLAPLGVLAVAFVVVTVVHHRRWPPVAVSLGSGELRAGGRVIPLASVNAAQFGSVPIRKRDPVLTLRLLSGEKARAEVLLRDRRGHELPVEQQQVLAEAIRRTAVAMPVSRDDPSGRFARYNFPGHIDRDDAVAVVLHPPRADEALPVPG
jgi:membrane protein YdbS with pleckstrin-like domain